MRRVKVITNSNSVDIEKSINDFIKEREDKSPYQKVNGIIKIDYQFCKTVAPNGSSTYAYSVLITYDDFKINGKS